MNRSIYSKLFLLSLFILLLLLVACNADGGNVYNYLQNQDIMKGDLVDNSNTSGSGNQTEPFIEGGVFEHLEKTTFKLDSDENDTLVEEGT